MIAWMHLDAIRFIRRWWATFDQRGIYIGLTGSVLSYGESKKDLDIILYPANATDKEWLTRAQETLAEIGLVRLFTAEQIREKWLKNRDPRKRGNGDTKHVEVWETKDHKRVDVFFLS